MTDAERARVDALHWVAEKLEAQAEELRQDWLKVMCTAGTRARIATLAETAAMCRAEARITTSLDVKGKRKNRAPRRVDEGKDTPR